MQKRALVRFSNFDVRVQGFGWGVLRLKSTPLVNREVTGSGSLVEGLVSTLYSIFAFRMYHL